MTMDMYKAKVEKELKRDEDMIAKVDVVKSKISEEMMEELKKRINDRIEVLKQELIELSQQAEEEEPVQDETTSNEQNVKEKDDVNKPVEPVEEEKKDEVLNKANEEEKNSMENKSLTIKPQYIPDITEFSSDGETFQGSMYFNGWYENENGNVKLITQLSFADVLVDGKLQEDGSYVIENDFISESNLSTDVESGKFGVVLQFKMDSKYVYFNKSLMQFPITLKL